MNKQFMILALLLVLAASQTYSITSCTCAQLLSEGDCLKNTSLGCAWDSTKKACAVSTTPVTPTVTYAAYCDTFAETDCPKAKPCTDCGTYAACAWVDKKCTFFTGCTAFAKTTDGDCQAISNRCITDGTHCVEVDACSTYKKQLPCVKNAAGSLCYWDTTNNTCVDANTCDKLPTTFATDKDCRDVISTCTTKTGGGCVDSGNNCSDQTLEIQCVWNKLKSVACYWDGAACKDRICDNAPTSLTTDDTCKSFRTDGTCTTKANGGCVTRTTCAAATIQAACVKNSSNGDCYWTGTACVDKTCTNAPTTMTTNSACAGFVTGCITKSGGGCVSNGACSAANVQAACVKNTSGTDCIWDTTCKEKTCANAPTTNNTHDLCTSYLSTCTVKSGGGCQSRTCANAPTTITTNDACEAYLPASNCITKSGGGCVTNTTCAVITLEAACVKNSSGAICFWDSASSTCKDKTCANAPATNTTNDLCVAFLSSCTLNSTSAGCVDKTCENSLVQTICDKDLNNKACIWKGKCYKKECVLASSTTATHADCQTYDVGCTLSNTGTGCVPLPLKCEAITIEAACNIRLQVTNGVKSYPLCGWNGSSCIDKACSTAPKTTATTSDCGTYKSGCVANNPVSGAIQGCQDLPTTCAARKSTENCEITRVGFPTCLWNSATSACVEKSCTTASVTTTTGFLTVFSSSNCSTYLTSCIANNTADGCIPKPSSCGSLTSSANCTTGSKANGDCYWNGSTCVDRTCANISLSTHSGCQGVLNTCTTNNAKTTCQSLATACTSYGSSENCKQTSAGKTCIWTGTACRNATCADAADTASYQSDSQCSAYPTPSDTCTVLYKTQALGCVTRSANCSDYVSSAQCYRTLTAASDDCTWKSSHGKCFSNTYLQGACSTFQGTKTLCEAIKLGCTNTNSAVETDTCTFSCALVTGTSLTHSGCQGYSTTCTANSAGTACLIQAAACSTYTAQGDCVRRTDGLSCFWNASASPAACQDITSTNCNALTSLTSATHATCQAYSTACTVISDGTACQALQAACSSYSAQTACTKRTDGLKCFWNASASPAACQDITSTNCNALTSLTGATHASCQAYNTACTVISDGTACQALQAACSSYSAQTACTQRTDGLKCFWNASASPAACQDITSTNCNALTSLTSATHATCQAYSTACTVISDGTACQALQAACSSYSAQTACTQRTDGLKCFWNASASPAACQDITSTNCNALTSLTSATHATCQAYSTACTVISDGTACQALQAACSSYSAQTACTQRTDGLKCFWNASASPAACQDITSTNCNALTSLTSATHATCQAYSTACTVISDGTACQALQAACSSYSAQTACTQRTDGLKCFWNASASPAACQDITSTNCNALTSLTSATHATCQAYSTACTVISDGTACQALQAACSSYSAQTACTQRTDGLKCFWNASASPAACQDITSSNCSLITGLSSATHATCQAYSTACYLNVAGNACQAFSTCEALTGSSLTWALCQAYSTTCSVKRDGTGCVTIQSACTGYTTMANCYRSTAGYCTANSGDTACQAISASTTCESIKLGSGYTFSDAICNTLKSGCIALATSGCQTKTCANKTTPFAHSDCNTWLSTCTSNAVSSPTACTTMAATCASLTTAACVYAVEGECVVSGSSCVRKTCDTASADTSFDSHAECIGYLSTCTVARTGGCQVRATCASYKSTQQCKFNSTGGKCFWNPTNKTCVDLNCGNIEATTSYDTHTECVAVDASLLCTVRATNGAAVAGCMARGACSSYSIEDQCKTNSSGGVCVWNTNLTTPVCQDKSCTTAPTATATHADCDAYFSTTSIKCTVVATPDTNGGTPVLGGCQQTAACSTYIHQEQCRFNATGDLCGWNGTQCADKSCATAPATTDYDDNDKCRAYFNNKCTVASSGQGCVDIPDTCESMTQKQCVSDKTGRSCYWNGTACITRTCENAPDSTASADDCNTYLAGCTLDSVKCKTKVCEDFAFATDALCKQALSTCTTNGTNCVTRGTCFQALNQAGCVTSSTNLQCEWMPAVGTNQAYCTVKTCNTAPATLTTESACASYFTNCTTKNGGGCVTKSTCSAVTIDVACTTALNGTVCAWDSAQNKCRDKDCQDFSGTTHAACQTQRAGCTAGANGKCARVQNCEQTTIRSACIEGTNGPCLWISSYVNTDGSTGACFRYTSCKSLTWNSDSSCKWISNQCTTNGSNCVGITLCSETNTDGGCVTGYDGACIQSVPALNSSDPKVCKPYTSCADAFYTTHSDCQIASKKCTTNGTTGCIALGACSSYTTQAGCYFNDKGAVLTSGAITSTGICTWDTTASSCRDQSCADLTGTTHATCSSQLSTCTSDGTSCLLKGACTSYTTQTACTTAVGSDGICYWELASATNNNTAKCRLLACADIQNGTSTNVCAVALSSCVSNGTACIAKANCSTYTTKTACNSGGLDGICVFTQSTATGAAAGTGTCALMTACTTASNDQLACQAAKDRCSWTAASGTGATAVASKCATHTCATNQATNGACTRFLNWDKKTQQICTLVSGTCTATDPSTLSLNDCFQVSGYTYTWNASTSKCGVCTAVVVQPNTSDNNTNNTTNQTTTDSGYILGLSTIVLGYLMF
ncbi:unnamed protein product [Paramecium octaurelia]|uniref:PSI domain-containing protein n=1 Tax=Paramecium octaurelia TaxID=43137 RepID=A0A8S1T0L0_PAROT|nr:unnamed protein product [Paramecium octaurelia]